MSLTAIDEEHYTRRSAAGEDERERNIMAEGNVEIETRAEEADTGCGKPLERCPAFP